MTKQPKRPRDPNQLAKLMVDIASGDIQDKMQALDMNPMASLGREGGLKGGPARREVLSPERRQEISRIAAKARWNRNGQKD